MPRLVFVFVLGACVLAAASPAFGSAIVYDNTTTATKGSEYPDGFAFAPDGFFAFSYYNACEPMGDGITLAGSERTVTKFDLLLSSTEPTTLPSLTLAFYSIDVRPKSQLWSATLEGIAVNGLTTVTFDVPNVVVGDTFAWAASADSDVAGLATFDPPPVGSSDDAFWDLDPTVGWLKLFFGNNPYDPAEQFGPVANFGARVEAIPEPASIMLLACGGLLMLRKGPQAPRG